MIIFIVLVTWYKGYYSDKPHAEVYVLPADEITKIINQKLR